VSDAVQEGTVLPGGAVVEGLLAEGRLCTVYRARTPGGDEVAARVLRQDLAGDLAEWFLNTARARASLDHPVLPRVYAFGYVNALPVEVTELLTGRTAQDLLDQGQNGLDVPTGVRMLRAVAAALDHLHATTPPTLHRALLPEHILVRERDGAVMLLAVGEAERPRIAVTRPAYLSPEELADVSSLSPRADVFSLATLTYELFTGRPAFVGGGDVVLDTVRMARFPRLREHRPDIHARAEHILREAWALTPDDRPPSAGRFAALFAEAVNQQAHTLVNVPTVSALKEQGPGKSTLSGPGPLDVATRKALQDGRASALAPTREDPPPPAASPARGTPASPRAPRSGRPVSPPAVTSQRPRSFLPKPGETTDDATRPEISVPSKVRAEEQSSSDETPIDGTSAPAPRFSRTTPGIPSPLPSTPTPIATSPTVTTEPAARVHAATVPDLADPSQHNAPREVTPHRGAPVSAPVPTPAPAPAPAAAPIFGPPMAPMANQGMAAQPAHATPHPSPLPPAPSPGPLTGTPFEPPPGAPPTRSNLAPEEDPRWQQDPDEDTQVIDIPAPKAVAPSRSPVVLAAALIANAIAIAGIAHAIAWVQLERATPTVIQAPPAVCAPCATCPAAVCPPTVCSPSAPAAVPVAPRVVAPRVAPPPPRAPATGPRPARAPAPAGLVRNVPTF
jgi:hypothetical protein